MNLDEANARLDSFLKLEPGWDSYGGDPPRVNAINLIRSLLAMDGFPRPTHLAACGNGDVGMTFGEGLDMEIGKESIMVLDSRGDAEKWQEWPVTKYRIGDMSEYLRLARDLRELIGEPG